MKYIVISRAADFTGDEFIKEFSDKTIALEEAEYEWNHLTNTEKKHNAVEVLESANPDEDSEDHFDGNVIAKYSRRRFTPAVNYTGFDDMFVSDDPFTADCPKDAAEQYAVYLESETEEGLEGAFIEIYDPEEGEKYHFLGEEL